MIKAIKDAIDNKQFIYWQRRGAYGLQLRAITYTWENGHERTKCLKEYDLKVELDCIVNTHQEVRELSDVGDFQLREILTKAWFDGSLQAYPDFLKETV